MVCMAILAHACLLQPQVSSNLTPQGVLRAQLADSPTPPPYTHSRSVEKTKNDESREELLRKFQNKLNVNLKQE